MNILTGSNKIQIKNPDSVYDPTSKCITDFFVLYNDLES